ncbi:MAG: ABC transporter permease [Methylacidiphilales bacterium]|nr:ABC transporter permease [Candidatus Methylacidiphilales bacterium]MDW8348927.1 ABC transporter permease [Verrucomicrobiae bacterium]
MAAFLGSSENSFSEVSIGWRAIWRGLWKRPTTSFALLILIILYASAVTADFIAPHNPTTQNLQATFHPPTRLFLKNGKIHVMGYRLIDPTAAIYKEDPDLAQPIPFLVSDSTYKFLGLIPMKLKLWQAPEGARFYLLGSDSTGRCVFSRLLYGARISLSVGIIGISITMILGCLIGCIAGYFGGWMDTLAMRLTEILMAVPGLYLLLALRSAFAEHFSSDQMYLLIVGILSFIGWSGTARVVRGLALSIKERPYVLASRALGQSTAKILTRHLLRNMTSYLIVAGMMSIPGYILGEAALSFLGVGIQEPSASWGLMLSQAQEMKVFMLNFWWLLSPGILIILTVLCFNILGEGLRDLVDPKFRFFNK